MDPDNSVQKQHLTDLIATLYTQRIALLYTQQLVVLNIELFTPHVRPHYNKQSYVTICK